MAKLKIKNFGPIVDGNSTNDGYIDINRLTVFIGEQGGGKSTIVKIYSSLCWLEKTIARNCQATQRWGERYLKPDYKLFLELLKNQNIPIGYARNKNLEIAYLGDFCSFEITYNKFIAKFDEFGLLHRRKGYSFDDKSMIMDEPRYVCPKITYIASERNILTSSASDVIDTSSLMPLYWLRQEIQAANRRFKTLFSNKKNQIFNKFSVLYDHEKKNNLIKTGRILISTSESSSGVQSYMPIFLVLNNSKYEIQRCIVDKIIDYRELISNFEFPLLFDTGIVSHDLLNSLNLKFNSPFEKKLFDYIYDLVNNRQSSEENFDKINCLTEPEEKYLTSAFKAYLNSRYICIVEEPEQNLFPSSQIEVLNNLITSTNQKGSKCIITTHSPYLLNYLNNYIYAGNKYFENEKKQNRISKIIKSDLLLKSSDVSAYKVGSGKIDNIFNSDENLIMSDEIDDYFEQNSNQFDKLLSV